MILSILGIWNQNITLALPTCFTCISIKNVDEAIAFRCHLPLHTPNPTPWPLPRSSPPLPLSDSSRQDICICDERVSQPGGSRTDVCLHCASKAETAWTRWLMLFTHYRIGTCRHSNIPSSLLRLTVGPPAQFCTLFTPFFRGTKTSMYSHLLLHLNLIQSLPLLIYFCHFLVSTTLDKSHSALLTTYFFSLFLNMRPLDGTCQRPPVEWFGGSVGPARSLVVGTHGGSLPAVSPYTRWLLWSCGNELRPSSPWFMSAPEREREKSMPTAATASVWMWLHSF